MQIPYDLCVIGFSRASMYATCSCPFLRFAYWEMYYIGPGR